MKFFLALFLVVVAVFADDHKNCTAFFGEVPSMYSSFILGNYNLIGSDNEGRVAVGGDAYIERSGIGFGLTGTCGSDVMDGPNSLVVAGNLEYTEGMVWHGDVVYGSGNAKDNVKVAVENNCQKYQEGSVIDFQHWEDYLIDLSDKLATKQANGEVEYEEAGPIITFKSNEDKIVFEVDSKKLKEAKYFVLDVPMDTKRIIINVVGGDSNQGFGQNGGISFREFEKFNTKVVWNFPSAVEMHLTSVGVHGSILAPRANFNNPEGEIYGQIFAGSWSGPMQQHAVFFEGCRKKRCKCCRHCE